MARRRSSAPTSARVTSGHKHSATNRVSSSEDIRATVRPDPLGHIGRIPNPYPHSSGDSAAKRFTSAVRLRIPSFRYTRERCASTVFGLMKSRSAISRFRRPDAAADATACSVSSELVVRPDEAEPRQLVSCAPCPLRRGQRLERRQCRLERLACCPAPFCPSQEAPQHELGARSLERHRQVRSAPACCERGTRWRARARPKRLPQAPSHVAPAPRSTGDRRQRNARLVDQRAFSPGPAPRGQPASRRDRRGSETGQVLSFRSHRGRPLPTRTRRWPRRASRQRMRPFRRQRVPARE